MQAEKQSPLFEPRSVPDTQGPVKSEAGSYLQILKSTALVGGMSVANIATGIVRTKAMAMLLGPAGFGLAGLYTSIAILAQNIAGMGVNSSGVRQIAEAASSDDRERIGRTAAVLRRTSLLLGVLGGIVLIVFSRQISNVTFGTDQNSMAVSLLSVAVFLNVLAAGQNALIQGLRQISELVQIGALGAFTGTLVTILIVYFLREDGVVPSLIAVAAVSMLTVWWYARKVQLPRCVVAPRPAMQEATALLKLGFVFMASNAMTLGTAYLVRVMVLHRVGLEATGFYQSAWTLGGLYVGFVLQAMGTDFYPRLTACARDNPKCNRLVNEQARVSLLLAGPGVIATLTFAPLMIALFYSGEFGASVGVLRWICLGAALQVITWPMGFIIIAKGEQALFFWCELAWTVVSIGLAWLCVSYLGLNGAGIAFFGSYIFHFLLLYPCVHRLSGFRWSVANIHTGMLFLSCIGIVFCGFYVLPLRFAVGIGAITLLVSCTYSVCVLLRLLATEGVPPRLRRLATALGIVPAMSPVVD